jgi:hypothetical protein
MIRNLGKLFMTFCLLASVGAVVANAQMRPTAPRIQANVSFPFVVGDTTLPAGKYEISTVDATSSPNVFELRSVNGRTSVVFETEDVQTPNDQPVSKTELVFKTIGNKHFLSQIWVAGTLTGSELPTSKMEKRLEYGGSQPEKHSIVASLKRLKP